MNHTIATTTCSLILIGALSGLATASWGADSTDATLASQSKQMDSLASTGSGTVAGRISADFATFAGSTANSDALVSGLRNGTAITLTSTDAKGVTTSTTFTPPTGKMGYGNVFISMALAQQSLANAGITQPTAQQLQAALMGGTVTVNGQTTTLTGILQLRSQGMGWGQIANSLGMKLGPVISSIKAANAQAASQAATKSGGTSTTKGAAAASKSGIVTGAGTSPGTSGADHGNAYGRGIVTGAGTGGVGTGQGNAYGRGIVTGTGGTAGQVSSGAAAQGKGAGKGN
jgi:hypothetical protein